MTAKTQAKSRIMGAVHVTARDLHAAGFIDTRRMRAYDALCLAPVPDYSRERIRALRQRHKPSRAVLAVLKAEAENQRAMIARLRTLRPTGRVVLELPEEASSNRARLMPGDAIVVPEDFDRTTFTRNLKDWTQILYQFGLGAAAIKILRQ
jgi:putative transcriptional regulator